MNFNKVFILIIIWLVYFVKEFILNLIIISFN